MVLVLKPVSEVGALADVIVDELREELVELAPGASVEHVGATALPAGVTKGDVDVAMSVRAEDFAAIIGRLEERYEISQRDNWTDTFASFSAHGHALPVGIQVAVLGSPDDFRVPLRELMRARPDLSLDRGARRADRRPLAAHRGGNRRTHRSRCRRE